LPAELASVAAERLDGIFIDEGFGALDLETLDVVIQALQRLREGDRMAGVITHVPTLAEQIPEGRMVESNGSVVTSGAVNVSKRSSRRS
jgi:exonuclease SbcC